MCSGRAVTCGVKADMGRRYRWYPTIVQEQVLNGWGHTVRALWNVALAQPCGRRRPQRFGRDRGPSPPGGHLPCLSGYGGGWLGRQRHAQAPFGAESHPPAEADA
ncbi:helix-turn-helix domain-containing protein [Streptomyces sp. NPDC057557]|uniref:helix-turn-helix domain-containing protein n=1 Tax=Streptomyces sp. NPDC057557 TaxID=3346167 RepID=UPI0036A89B80